MVPWWQATAIVVLIALTMESDGLESRLGGSQDSSVGSEQEREVVMLQMEEGLGKYPWVISQQQAQQRAKKLHKQQAQKRSDDAKLKSHDVPLKDTLRGPGIAQRVQQELQEYESTHGAKDSQETSSRTQETSSRTSQFDADVATAEREEGMGEGDSEEEVQRSDSGRSDEDDDPYSIFERHQHREESAWGDDDANDDIPDPEFLLQEKEGHGDQVQTLELIEQSESAPDMMSMLANNMKKKHQRYAKRAKRRAIVRVQQEHKNALQDEVDAQKSFTQALNKQMHKFDVAEKATKTNLPTLLKHRHKKVDKNGFRFVPKSKAEMDHKKEVSDDAKIQKKLAQSFQLAMQSAVNGRKEQSKALNDAEAAGKGLHKAEAVRNLFDSTSKTGLKVGQKLQPQMKKEDNSWLQDARQQQEMARKAAKFGNARTKDKDQELGESEHDMKKLFPEREKKQAKYDETGMKIDLQANTQQPSDEAVHAKHMQEMMLRATLRAQKAAAQKIEDKHKTLGDTKAISSLFHQHGDGKAAKSKTVSRKAAKKAVVPGGTQALKLAQKFLNNMKQMGTHNSEADAKGKDPASRNDMKQLLQGKHKQVKQSKALKKHVLTAEDAAQVKMQEEMAKRTEAALQERVESARSHDSDNKKDISTLFNVDKKQAKQHKSIYEGYLKDDDRKQVSMQKAFAQAQLARQQISDKPEQTATRKGVSQLFRGTHAKQVAPKATSETEHVNHEFEQQKKMQLALLRRMKDQQKKMRLQAKNAEKQIHGKEDLLQLFRASNNAHEGSWERHQARLRRARALHKQKDESAILGTHTAHGYSVPAPKIVQQTEFEQDVAARETPQQRAMALEQEAVGNIKPAAETMKQKMAQKMKNHFVSLLEKNKLKFNKMMKSQGVQGADDFYQEMKSDLDTMLTPDNSLLKGAQKDSLLQKSEGQVKQEPKKAKASAKVLSSKLSKATKQIHAALKVAAKPMKAPKTDKTVKVTKAADKVTQSKAAPAMDLAALEKAVDQLSPEDKHKFIMHRLAKLASD